MKVTQLYLTLCDTHGLVHGILQARILEWVAPPFSWGSYQPREDWTLTSCIAGGFFYQLSHKRSPRILEWVAHPFSSGSSWPRNRTTISRIAGRFFTSWAIREAQWLKKTLKSNFFIVLLYRTKHCDYSYLKVQSVILGEYVISPSQIIVWFFTRSLTLWRTRKE